MVNQRFSEATTFSFLNDFNNVVTVELFKARDEQIYGQSSVAGADDPVGQQSKTRIQFTTEFLHQTSLISYKNIRYAEIKYLQCVRIKKYVIHKTMWYVC